MKLSEITPEKVVESYRATGLIPVYGLWNAYNEHNQRCGCALTALAMAAGANWLEFRNAHDTGSAASVTVKLTSALQLESEQADEIGAFIGGFDCDDDQSWTYDEDQKDVYRAGRACRLAVKEAFGI